MEILNLLNPWWFGKKTDTGITRSKYLSKLENSLFHKRAVLLVGSRRVGKTTLCYQLITKLLAKTKPHHILYALLDHPQLASFSILDLVEQFRQQFDLDRKEKLFLFLDEVQYIRDWEREVKALSDTENIKIFLSGSASSQLLLKSPYLTGRTEKIEVYPLDFREYLAFKNISISEIERYKYEKQLDDYLKIGGYPEYVLENDPAYFSDLVNNILYKDIVSIYQLKNPDLLRDLLLLLSDRVGSQTTYTKLAAVLSLKNDTVKEYIYYLKNILLLSELPRFTYSRSHRIYGPKKFYLSDNGLLFHLLGKMRFGSVFEQSFYNYIRQSGIEAGFYYEKQKEVDFIIKTDKGKEFWEVKYEITQEGDEELKKILPIAIKEKAEKIVFVTRSFEKKRKIKNISAEFIPLWKILIGV